MTADDGMTPDEAARALSREFGAEPQCRVDQAATSTAVACPPDQTRALYGLLVGAWRGKLHTPPTMLRDDDTATWAEHGWLLLVGTRALAGWRSDLRIGEAEGRWGVWQGAAMVMAVRDPFTLGRRDHAGWRMHIDRFFTDATPARDARTSLLPVTCWRCGQAVWTLDSDGAGWCKKHHTENTRGTGKKGKGMRQGMTQGTGLRDRGQGVML